MCGQPRPRFNPRDLITNWQQDLPLRTKLRLTARNIWTRLSTPSTCCGHPGEPGC
ncbi:MAG: hypothetical protein ABI847_01895 [Anaerolineales bacterium]